MISVHSIDKKEFDESENLIYFDYQAHRAAEKPPPDIPCRVAVECYGLTMARGGGRWTHIPIPIPKHGMEYAGTNI